MALADDLSTALKEAMKAKDKPKLDAIRQIQTEIAKKKSEKGEEVNDELVLGVISSYVKKMAKAVDEYKSLGEKGEEMFQRGLFFAVHSRHISVLLSQPLLSQYYGTCELWNID